MHHVLVCLLTFLVLMPFFVLGIVATGVVLLHLLGIGPGETSAALAILFLLLVPFGIGGFGLLGYGLLVALLRITGLEPWYDAYNPPLFSSVLDRPATAVRSLVHHIVPRVSPWY